MNHDNYILIADSHLRQGEEGPFFIILRCILICTSDVVSVMDGTEGKITAQEAQQRGKKIKEI